MKYLVDIPNFGPWHHPRVVADFARRVEDAGWDGFSVWDHILVYNGNEVADPWVLLTAVAMETERIKLMSLVTPLPRRRPWVLARQTVGIDLLSEGRLILGVGIGYPPGPEFRTFHEATGEQERADMLDEGLEVLTGLWSGENFRYRGEHYRLDNVVFQPTPVQQPRIPIWVAGMWPARRPFRRAARYDGLCPIAMVDGEFHRVSPAMLREMTAYTMSHREIDTPFDIAPGGMLAGQSGAADLIAEYEAAGATWWREGFDPDGGRDHASWIDAILEGPPRP